MDFLYFDVFFLVSDTEKGEYKSRGRTSKNQFQILSMNKANGPILSIKANSWYNNKAVEKYA